MVCLRARQFLGEAGVVDARAGQVRQQVGEEGRSVVNRRGVDRRGVADGLGGGGRIGLRHDAAGDDQDALVSPHAPAPRAVARPAVRRDEGDRQVRVRPGQGGHASGQQVLVQEGAEELPGDPGAGLVPGLRLALRAGGSQRVGEGDVVGALAPAGEAAREVGLGRERRGGEEPLDEGRRRGVLVAGREAVRDDLPERRLGEVGGPGHRRDHMGDLVDDEVVEQAPPGLLGAVEDGRVEGEVGYAAAETRAVDARTFEVAHHQAGRQAAVEDEQAVLGVRLEADAGAGEQAQRRQDRRAGIGAQPRRGVLGRGERRPDRGEDRAAVAGRGFEEPRHHQGRARRALPYQDASDRLERGIGEGEGSGLAEDVEAAGRHRLGQGRERAGGGQAAGEVLAAVGAGEVGDAGRDRQLEKQVLGGGKHRSHGGGRRDRRAGGRGDREAALRHEGPDRRIGFEPGGLPGMARDHDPARHRLPRQPRQARERRADPRLGLGLAPQGRGEGGIGHEPAQAERGRPLRGVEVRIRLGEAVDALGEGMERVAVPEALLEPGRRRLEGPGGAGPGMVARAAQAVEEAALHRLPHRRRLRHRGVDHPPGEVGGTVEVDDAAVGQPQPARPPGVEPAGRGVPAGCQQRRVAEGDRAGLALRGHEVGAALAQPGVDQALDGEAGLHGIDGLRGRPGEGRGHHGARLRATG